MSTMVTARVSNELFDQGKAVLEAIGATNTDLIRAAYQYLIEVGSLPKAAEGTSKRQKLSKQDQIALLSKLDAMSVDVSLPEDWDYKTVLAEGKWADYEALA